MRALSIEKYGSNFCLLFPMDAQHILWL